MKINQIILSEMATTAGSVATVAKPMGETQKRPSVRGLQPAEKVMFGKSKKTGPYGNSLSESKVKELAMDLKGGKDGLTDEEFKKKYGKTKQEVRKEMQNKPQKQEPVSEARLEEEDIIVIPGQGRKMKTGFVPHGKSRIDHEVEMAKSDLLQLLKNTKSVMMCIQDKTEQDGLEGWVQEKIIKAADYMNTLAEYFEGKGMSEEITSGGVIAGGMAGESKMSNPLEVGKWIQFGMWSKPQEHQIGRIMKINNELITVVIDGGPYSGKMVDLYQGNKSLVIKPAQEPNKGLASVRNEGKIK
jgi:hypothetical protein